MPKTNRAVALALLVISLALLAPGIFAPVLTIRGVLTKEGVAYVAPMMLEKGLNEETMKTLRSLINPSVVSMMQALGGDLRKMIIDKLGPQLTAALQQGVETSRSISRRAASSARCGSSTTSAVRCPRR